MTYVKTQNDRVVEFPYTFENLRRDNPHVSFPKKPSEQELVAFGVFKVQVEGPPKIDERTHKAVRDDIPVAIEGRWVLGWRVEEKTEKEKEEYRDFVAATVRRRRDDLLMVTDWMALSDTTLEPAWAAYRQALRDIPKQSGFPFNVTWPSKPSS